MDDAVIVSACRTPIGSFGGGLKDQSAADLGAHFIVSSSLTKSYGLAGLRCGWIVAEPRLAEMFRVLLPLTAIGGATLLVAADIVARVAIPAAELPIAAVAISNSSHETMTARRWRTTNGPSS